MKKNNFNDYPAYYPRWTSGGGWTNIPVSNEGLQYMIGSEYYTHEQLKQKFNAQTELDLTYVLRDLGILDDKDRIRVNVKRGNHVFEVKKTKVHHHITWLYRKTFIDQAIIDNNLQEMVQGTQAKPISKARELAMELSNRLVHPKPTLIENKPASTDLSVFTFESKEIRIIEKNGEPWFVAKDVINILDYTWSGSRITHVPSEWRGLTPIVTPSGTQEMAVLSEQGLYFFLARSDKPLALPFQKWIAGEVLPSICKTGQYAIQPTPQPTLDLSNINAAIQSTLANCAAIIQHLNTELVVAKQIINDNAGLIGGRNAATDTDNLYLLGTIAKYTGTKKVPVKWKQGTLREILIKDGLILATSVTRKTTNKQGTKADKTEWRYSPSAYAHDNGWLVSVESGKTVDWTDKTTQAHRSEYKGGPVVRATPKGFAYILWKYGGAERREAQEIIDEIIKKHNNNPKPGTPSPLVKVLPHVENGVVIHQ